MKLPGTSPPNVQNRYSTPSVSFRTTSRTSSSTMTLVAFLRLIGGEKNGAGVRTAFSSPLTSGSTFLETTFPGSLATFSAARTAGQDKPSTATAAAIDHWVESGNIFIKLSKHARRPLAMLRLLKTRPYLLTATDPQGTLKRARQITDGVA